MIRQGSEVSALGLASACPALLLSKAHRIFPLAPRRSRARASRPRLAHVTETGDKHAGRRLRDVAEPIAAAIYFAREAAEEYEKLGLSNFLAQYFCSRSAPLGRAPGAVVAAAFAAFNPKIVIPSVEEGWSRVSPEEVTAARLRAASRLLERVLGDVREASEKAAALVRPAAERVPYEGMPLFAGLAALPWPADPHAQLFRACDLIREHRGDAHTIAWRSKGLTAIEITLLSEPYWGLPHRSYVHTRGFGKEEVEEATRSLQERGLLASDFSLTEEGRRLREEIENLTDALQHPMVEAIGRDEVEGLIETLRPLAQRMTESGAYVLPGQIAGRLSGRNG
jgi:hypothetical protein